MFLGTHKATFSGPGRVILPKRFRAELGKSNRIVLSRGLDGCIWGYEKKAWEREAKNQLKIPVTDDQGRNLRRLLFSGTEIIDLDLQGRFVIPKALLDWAKIKGRVVIIGAGDHFEIWDTKEWEQIIKTVET